MSKALAAPGTGHRRALSEEGSRGRVGIVIEGVRMAADHRVAGRTVVQVGDSHVVDYREADMGVAMGRQRHNSVEVGSNRASHHSNWLQQEEDLGTSTTVVPEAGSLGLAMGLGFGMEGVADCCPARCMEDILAS
jgi:hypothetical protein